MNTLLIPLWVALSLLGMGDLGMSYDQTHSAYVRYEPKLPIPRDSDDKYSGFACVEGHASPVFSELCRELPARTIVVRYPYWPMDSVYNAYMIRHEMEHIFRGAEGVSAEGEIAATKAGCAVAFVGWFKCGGGEWVSTD